MSNYPKVYNVVAKGNYSDETLVTSDDGKSYFLEDEAKRLCAKRYLVRKDDKGNIVFEYKPYLKELPKDEVENMFNTYTFNPFTFTYNEEKYSQRLLDKLIKFLKDEKSDIKEEKNMAEEKKREEVLVRFWETDISKKIIYAPNSDKKVKLLRVKLPNDDPKDSTARRAFLIAENKVHDDKFNDKRKICFLGKDQEYRVTRPNFDPETKKEVLLEDIKMTGQAISDVFKAEADKSYEAWKASQPVRTNEIETTDEVVAENTAGAEM